MGNWIEDEIAKLVERDGNVDRVIASIYGDTAKGKIAKMKYDENLKTTIVEMENFLVDNPNNELVTDVVTEMENFSENGIDKAPMPKQGTKSTRVLPL